MGMSSDLDSYCKPVGIETLPFPPCFIIHMFQYSSFTVARNKSVIHHNITTVYLEYKLAQSSF